MTISRKIATSVALIFATTLAISGCTPGEYKEAPEPGSEGRVTVQVEAPEKTTVESIDDLIALYEKAGGKCSTFTEQTEGVIEGNTVGFCEDGSTVAYIGDANKEYFQSMLGSTPKGFDVVAGENWMLMGRFTDKLGEAMGGDIYR